MARARNIKPGFFVNEDLVELPFETRLLFIGLWTIADREGRLLDRPKTIKMSVFPADNIDVDPLLQQLHDAGFLSRYIVGEQRLIQITNFVKHQKPHQNETESLLPCQQGLAPLVEALVPMVEGLAPLGEALGSERVMMNDESGKSNDEVSDKSKTTKPQKPKPPVGVEAIREVCNLYPPKPNWDTLHAVVTDKPDIALLARCFQEWTLRGFKPTNYKWVTEWYAQGGPADTHRPSQNAPPPHDNLMCAGKDFKPITPSFELLIDCDLLAGDPDATLFSYNQWRERFTTHNPDRIGEVTAYERSMEYRKITDRTVAGGDGKPIATSGREREQANRDQVSIPR